MKRMHPHAVFTACALLFLCALASCGDDHPVPRFEGPPRDHRTVCDVPVCFQRLEDSVREGPGSGSTDRYLGANNDPLLIPWPSYSILGDVREHIQGVQRYKDYLVLSAGIRGGEGKASQLIVVRMGSRTEDGAWSKPYGNPQFDHENPSPLDRVIAVIDVDNRKWHAGGIQMAGPILAVPIYGDGDRAQVRFFDFSRPETPAALEDITLISPENSPSRAVGLIRIPNKHYLLLVWDDRNLYFYLSRTTDIHQGFDASTCFVVSPEDVRGGFQTEGSGPFGFSTYQNLTFVTDRSDGVYLVATRNTQVGSPVLTGKNFATLYKVSWPGGDHERRPEIDRVESKQIHCHDHQCDFAAGAGTYVDADGELFLYAVPHHLRDFNRRIPFNEYAFDVDYVQPHQRGSRNAREKQTPLLSRGNPEGTLPVAPGAGQFLSGRDSGRYPKDRVEDREQARSGQHRDGFAAFPGLQHPAGPVAQPAKEL